jgi:hypothetical protein
MSFANIAAHWFCSIMLVCGTRKLRQFLLGFGLAAHSDFALA